MLAAKRTATFTESVIREMSRIATQHEAINLAQGFPDFPMPEPMKEAARTEYFSIKIRVDRSRGWARDEDGGGDA